MDVKDKLQIILITYNRANLVESTLEQFFNTNSPLKNFDFLVLNNNSTDNTEDVVKKWQEKYPNIRYIKNKYNLGVTGNIVKAIEVANKDYVWIIGDDDKYDFSNWNEVEVAINNEEKVICVARYAIPDEEKNDIPSQLFQLTFITGGIYKTSLFNDTTIRNVYENIYTLFPYIAPVIQHINDNGHIYVVDKAICDNGMDLLARDYSYTRGVKNKENIYIRTRTMSWIVGYCNILSQLKDKKLKEDSINKAILYKDIYGSFNKFYEKMQMYYPNELFMHFIDVYINVSDKHKKQLKADYLLKATFSKDCNIAQFSLSELLTLTFRKISKLIYNLEKTQDKRYLTIIGIKITTKRRKK